MLQLGDSGLRRLPIYEKATTRPNERSVRLSEACHLVEYLLLMPWSTNLMPRNQGKCPDHQPYLKTE